MERVERELLAAIEVRSRDLCRHHDAAHDVAHIQRVCANATRIIERERTDATNPNRFVVLAACWLHDVIQLPKGAGEPGESARRSSDYACNLLDELGVEPDIAKHIADAVRTHSYSGGEKPATLEAAIVQDADRLDALGAVGIARLFIVAGTLESALYHPDDPLARERPLEDSRYALDHIATKLVKLPGLMNTASARQIAGDRLDYLLAYRDQFMHEIDDESYEINWFTA